VVKYINKKIITIKNIVSIPNDIVINGAVYYRLLILYNSLSINKRAHSDRIPSFIVSNYLLEIVLIYLNP
jgi:hypothetical protein